MTRLHALLDLPLLAKELNEQAVRRRTYVIRFAYGALLFGAACGLFYGDVLEGSGSGASALGRGGAMLDWIVALQFWGIYLFLPAMACGAIAQEKENQNLGLLLITGLTPWQIILQKLLSRLVPIYTFLLMSLPLMAIAYSFGGVTEERLWSGIVLLALTAVQVGALSLACSAYFRTTAEAFVATYCFLFALSTCCFPMAFGPNVINEGVNSGLGNSILRALAMSLSIAAMLGAARTFLVNRAFVLPRNLLLQLFRRLDQFFNEANAATGHIVLVRDGQELPADEPVAWRETAKRSLGTVRYLFRILVVLEVPILIVIEWLRGAGSSADLDSVTALLYTLWGIALALLIVHATSVVSAERARQTLDVLLTTPLTGRDIVLQKFRGVRRLIGVLSVPFLTIFFFESWWNGWLPRSYLIFSILTAGAYFVLVGWLAMWMGLRSRSPIRTILLTIGIVAAIVAFPAGLRYFVIDVLEWNRAAAVEQDKVVLTALDQVLIALSPTDTVRMLELLNTRAYGLPDPPILAYTFNVLLYGGFGFWFRRLCLLRADARLGRLAPEPATELAGDMHRHPESNPQLGNRHVTDSSVDPDGRPLTIT